MSAQDTAATEEVVDTSTNDEAQATEDELAESDISFEDADDDSEDEETEESEETDEDESANDSEDVTEEESKEDENQETPAKDSKADAEAQKRYNDEMAKKRIAEREAKKALDESQKKYVDEADGPHQTAVRQLQVDAYNNKVNRNNDVLQNSIDKALAHIDLFTNGSPEVKEALYEAADDFEAMYVTRDQYGNPVEVKGDLFLHLQKKAGSIRRLTGLRDEKAAQDRSKTKSRTVSTPSRTPKKPKSDPMMEGFDEEADRW